MILGASLGSIPYLAEELIAASPRWRGMVQNVGTVATHAAQFWLNRTAEDLGWNALVAQHNPGPQTDLKTVITSFTEPLDTWADMSDLIPHEDWPDDGPIQLAYFCSPAHNVGVDPAPFKDRVRGWANRDLTRMWPGAAKDGRFDLSLLWGPKDQDPEDRFKTQYFRQNFYGSERYVLSVPNSVQYRLPPDESGFQNLFLAGDWTRCGINAGCVEAATISGLVGARGLTGYAFEVVGESDLLPDTGPTDRTQLASPYAQTAPWPLTSFFGTGAVDGWFSFHAVDAAALAGDPAQGHDACAAGLHARRHPPGHNSGQPADRRPPLGPAALHGVPGLSGGDHLGRLCPGGRPSWPLQLPAEPLPVEPHGPAGRRLVLRLQQADGQTGDGQLRNTRSRRPTASRSGRPATRIAALPVRCSTAPTPRGSRPFAIR